MWYRGIFSSTVARSSARRQARPTSQPSHRRLLTEQLERRELLSIQPLGEGGILIEEAATDSGTISGTVWFDLNGNQTLDAREELLADRVVYVDLNENGEFDAEEPYATTRADDPATAANESGSYTITGVPVGTHQVAMVLPDGWWQTSPNSSEITTELISKSYDGSLADGSIHTGGSISGDGRYVAYTSFATNLVEGDDTSSGTGVYVYDRVTGVTERIDVGFDGSPANGSGRYPTLSQDGRYVVFESFASNLIEGDTNGKTDVFLRDRLTGDTELISVATSGEQSDYNSRPCYAGSDCISEDGRYVVFSSNASNLDPAFPAGTGYISHQEEIYLRDRVENITRRISVGWNGEEADGYSNGASISADGQAIVFCSHASNLVADDTNTFRDVFLYDVPTGNMQCVSRGNLGGDGGHVSNPAISGNGRFIVFSSLASNLGAGDENGLSDVFVFDRQTQTIERIAPTYDGLEPNGDSYNPVISADGRFIAFSSIATNFCLDTEGGIRKGFLYDRELDIVHCTLVTPEGARAHGRNRVASISDDGQRLVLVASDSDLVADDVNGWEDVFLQEIGQLYPMIQEVTVTVSCSVTQVDFGCKNADEIHEYLRPLRRIEPLGSMTLGCAHEGTVASAGQRHHYPIELQAGQTLTLLVAPDETLQTGLQLRGPNGEVIEGLTVQRVGNSLLLQGVEIQENGTYEIVVSGDSSTTGTFTLSVVLNAVLDAGLGEVDNDSPTNAADLDASFLAVDDQGSARAAVIGGLRVSSATALTELAGGENVSNDVSTADESGSEDWYRFSLADGQVTTVALATLDRSADVLLQLYDSAGRLLAVGLSSENITTAIKGYVDDTTDGLVDDYYVRVSSAEACSYQLVVTRDATFEVEANDQASSAQLLEGDWRGLGYLPSALPEDVWTSWQCIASQTAGTGSYLGRVLACDGETLVIGAYQDDHSGRDSGAAYVYRSDGLRWVFEQRLVAPVPWEFDRFGATVAVDNDTILVAAHKREGESPCSGIVYVFQRENGTWQLSQEIVSDHVNESVIGGDFGESIDLDGDLAIIGSDYDDQGGFGAGAAFVYRFNGTQWVKEQELRPSAIAQFMHFGGAVAIDGNAALISANKSSLEDTTECAFVFEYDGASWQETQKLTTTSANENSYFAQSLALDGDTAVIGARYDDGVAASAGAAIIFRRVDSEWVEQQVLTPSTEQGFALFGASVAVLDDTIVVGAPGDFMRYPGTGRAYVYSLDGDQWVEQQQLTPWDADYPLEFGYCVSLSQDTIIVGAPNSEVTGRASGAVYVFNGRLDEDYPAAATRPPVDCYSVSVEAGDRLVLSLAPPQVPCELSDDLQVKIELYDPQGNLVAVKEADDEASQPFVAEVSGMYLARVLGVGDQGGEYILCVDGATGEAPPFEAMYQGESTFWQLPERIQVDFNEAVLWKDVDASDFRLNGQAVSEVIVVDGDTAELVLQPSAQANVAAMSTMSTVTGSRSLTLASSTSYSSSFEVTIAAGAIRDLQGTPIEAFSLQLTIENDGPVAVGDTYDMPSGSALRIWGGDGSPSVLHNDASPQGGALSAVVETQPQHGTLDLAADGTFVYTPNDGFTGTDTFTYRASDGQLTSDAATVAINVLSPTSSGPIDFLHLTALDSSAPQWYAVTTVRDGLLTIDGANARVYDDQFHLQAATEAFGPPSYAVELGETYFVRFAASSEEVDIRIANLVARDGDHWLVYGTDGDDTFTADATDTEADFSVNGIQYKAATSTNAKQISFDGLDGNDQVTLIGTDGADTAVLEATTAELSGSGYAVFTTNVENPTVYGRAGEDTITFYDNAGRNQFVAGRGFAGYLTGFAGELRSYEFELVTAYATDGIDEAKLYDSAGDDVFVSDPNVSTLTGGGMTITVHDFQGVHAYATLGGVDKAYFTDTALDDQVIGTHEYAIMWSPNYEQGVFNRSKFFEESYAVSSHGGADIVKFYDGPGDDAFVADEHEASFTCVNKYTTSSVFVEDFVGVHAFASTGTGYDTATFYDSTGNDEYYSDAVQAALWNTTAGWYNRAKFFERTDAYATAGGTDKATLVDSTFDDNLLLDANSLTIYGADNGHHFGTSFRNRIELFDTVYAKSIGGTDVLELEDSNGADTLEATGHQLSFFSAEHNLDYVLEDIAQTTAKTDDNNTDTRKVLDYLFDIDFEGRWRNAP